MRPGVSVEFFGDVPGPLPPSFPMLVTVALCVRGYLLPLHYWIPTPEHAYALARGDWR